jgi:hypothetical protein
MNQIFQSERIKKNLEAPRELTVLLADSAPKIAGEP